MLSQLLCINVKHHKTGELVQECLEEITLPELEKLKFIFLELPISFIGADRQLYQGESVVLCQCIIHDFERYNQPLLDYPQGAIVVTPLIKPVAENIGPIKSVS